MKAYYRVTLPGDAGLLTFQLRLHCEWTMLYKDPSQTKATLPVRYVNHSLWNLVKECPPTVHWQNKNKAHILLNLSGVSIEKFLPSSYRPSWRQGPEMCKSMEPRQHLPIWIKKASSTKVLLYWHFCVEFYSCWILLNPKTALYKPIMAFDWRRFGNST